MKKDKKYFGTFKNGKMVYHTPTYNALGMGNWKDGWSGVVKTGGDEILYSIINPNNLIEGKNYHFIIIDDENVEVLEDKPPVKREKITVSL